MRLKQQKVLDINTKSHGRRFAREGFFERAKRRPMKGFSYPGLVPYVLCQPCPNLPVGMDYLFACSRSAPFARDLRGITLRLHDFAGGLGDAGDQRHSPTETLDDLLQITATRQRESAAPRAGVVSTGSDGFARWGYHAGDRRHPGATHCKGRAGLCHSARSRPQEQSAFIPAG